VFRISERHQPTRFPPGLGDKQKPAAVSDKLLVLSRKARLESNNYEAGWWQRVQEVSSVLVSLASELSWLGKSGAGEAP